MKEQRRIEQERNIKQKEKLKELHKKKSLEGMKRKKLQDEDDDRDNDAKYFREETGIDPDEGIFAPSKHK